MPKTAKKDKWLNLTQPVKTPIRKIKTQNECMKDEVYLGRNGSEDFSIEIDVRVKFEIQEHEYKSLLQAETSTTMPQIKSEELKMTLHQPPEEEATNNSGEIGCDECDKFFKTNKTYHTHLDIFHHFQEDCKPDKSDPSWYCKPCKLQFSRTETYLYHLKVFHNMKIKLNKRVLKAEVIHPNQIPEINDPHHFCRACEKSFTARKYYTKHLKDVHEIVKEKPVIYGVDPPRLLPDWNDPSFYCSACNKTFKRRYNYRVHLNQYHKMPNTIEPKPNKGTVQVTDFYCSDCQKYYSTKGSLKRHFPRVHGAKEKTVMRYPHPKPDHDDPLNYCCTCDKYYSDKPNYRAHLRMIHNIRESQDTRADYLKHYCRKCQIQYETMDEIRQHLKEKHKTEQIPRVRAKLQIILHPELTPDPFHPESYCCACDKTYRKNSFRRHLIMIHDMDPEKLSKQTKKPILLC